MLFNVLNKLNFDGTLEIIDYKNNTHKYGTTNQVVRIRLTNKAIERKLFLNPSLHIGEAYMNKELIVENGSIEDFLNYSNKFHSGTNSLRISRVTSKF